jgi:hypothetical protein
VGYSAVRVPLTALSPASCFTMLTAEAFETFLHQPRGHEEGRRRVGPPPTRHGIGHQPQQERQGEIRAGQRLLRLRPERGTADGLGRGIAANLLYGFEQFKSAKFRFLPEDVGRRMPPLVNNLGRLPWRAA